MSRTDDPHPLIKRFRAMGMSDPVIYGRLILEGWADEDIRHAFMHRPEASALVAPPPVEKKHETETWTEVEEEIVEVASRKRFSLATLAVAVFVAGGIGASAYFYLKPPTTYSISIPGATAAAASIAPELSYGALPALSDPDYHKTVKANLIAQKSSFIDANLTAMQLLVYKDGELVLQVPIAAKGKVGSWWETPAGIYKIETKEKNHFSTIERVDLPYSLNFQGNFFIHGWPVQEDGTPVASTHSGGCIRLQTADAERLFAIVEIGMPVIVYNEDKGATPFSYSLKVPSIAASEYLVVDLDTGTVLTEKNPSGLAPIASITKLMTALVATEYINLDKKITVPQSALVNTPVPRLKAGQTVRAYDLLFLLLQESSNEAAEVLASVKGREQFVTYMNKKAQAIGLESTSFNDPSGLRSDISTPEDLYKLLRYIYDNRRFVFGITTGEITDSAYGKPVFGHINNFNPIKSRPARLLGGKVGQTNEAGKTYAGVFAANVGGRTERKVAVIVLDSTDVQSDVTKLLNFVQSSYAPASQ